MRDYFFIQPIKPVNLNLNVKISYQLKKSQKKDKKKRTSWRGHGGVCNGGVGSTAAARLCGRKDPRSREWVRKAASARRRGRDRGLGATAAWAWRGPRCDGGLGDGESEGDESLPSKMAFFFLKSLSERVIKLWEIIYFFIVY